MHTIQTCTKCHVDKPLSDFYYRRLSKKHATSCKKCNTRVCGEYARKVRQTPDGLFQQRAPSIRRDAKLKGVPVADNLKDLLRDQWKKQDGKCYYTGLPMVLDNYEKGELLAVTVDRKIPALGYVEGNLALCCSIVNRMKQNLTYSELRIWCERLLKYSAEESTLLLPSHTSDIVKS